MGGELKVDNKSSNINIQMESDLVNIMKDAFENKKGYDDITAKCQKSFGGSWILIAGKAGKNGFLDMSFAFKSLKWIKFQHTRDYSKYFLFQISEQFSPYIINIVDDSIKNK